MKYERYENGVLVESVAYAEGELDTITLAEIRNARNPLLKEADIQINKHFDLGHENLGAWQTYRQALRDVTSSEDIYNITWPTKPATLP